MYLRENGPANGKVGSEMGKWAHMWENGYACGKYGPNEKIGCVTLIYIDSILFHW